MKRRNDMTITEENITQCLINLGGVASASQVLTEAHNHGLMISMQTIRQTLNKLTVENDRFEKNSDKYEETLYAYHSEIVDDGNEPDEVEPDEVEPDQVEPDEVGCIIRTLAHVDDFDMSSKGFDDDVDPSKMDWDNDIVEKNSGQCGSVKVVGADDDSSDLKSTSTSDRLISEVKNSESRREREISVMLNVIDKSGNELNEVQAVNLSRLVDAYRLGIEIRNSHGMKDLMHFVMMGVNGIVPSEWNDYLEDAKCAIKAHDELSDEAKIICELNS